MIRHGSTYRVQDQVSGRVASPTIKVLNYAPEAEFSGQPDIIKQLAKYIHHDLPKGLMSPFVLTRSLMVKRQRRWI